ncbi:ABC transporter substrate-binding protein [Colwellia sp. RSH04]|uniref:substrate-binding periplasmic protein n=1 Tax=Colwellia sp. RSH04 TaxID=2305464 RepID=UPI000E569A26|nr:transporter substrate-binding domain-containing protein [Colwellia sp. RSH04]RHW77170.1 hypothetical protein D1094_04570 [Colwellia sp. RSH04]
MKSLPIYFISLILSLIPFSVLASNIINVATYIEPPFADNVGGKYVGRNIRLSKQIARHLNKQINFIRCPMARCIMMMESGQTDMILSVLKTPQREKFMSYIEPAIGIQQMPVVFYTLKSKKFKVTSFKDLHSLLIGKIRGARYFEEFDNNTSLSTIEVTSRGQLVQMLLKGRIDTFIAREESIKPLISNNNYQKLAISQYQYEVPVNGYIAVSKKSYLYEQRDEISTFIKQIQATGKLDKVYYTDP